MKITVLKKNPVQPFSLLIIIWLPVIMLISFGCDRSPKVQKQKITDQYATGKPFTRWWWFAREIEEEDIKAQLDWVKEQGFGGVEIAFIYPVNRNLDAERTPWLSKELTQRLVYTKNYCEQVGLGCDFTFGTLWPFGGTFVPDEDATKVFGDPDFKQPLRLSWTHPDTGNVLDHLSGEAFYRYANVMGKAFEPALQGNRSSLFCDSWEVETYHIWTNNFDQVFEEKFGYDIKPYMPEIYADENYQERYDYMKLVSEMVLDSFYIPFTEVSHKMGAYSRAQCSGSPSDLIDAYAATDIPETEAMLYEPNFSKIVASAAALSGKPLVSSETFTCLYGFPAEHFAEEQTADLKLVADALFANGVNQIIWHGMPFNPVGVDSIHFYATVHVGKDGNLAKDLKPFNAYLTKVSQVLQKGKTYTDVAVYLPLEDAWIAGEYPDSLQMPWSWGQYELRYVHFPKALDGFHPTWINRSFIQKLKVENSIAKNNDCEFRSLVVDSKFLDLKTLEAVYHLAVQKLPVFLLQQPEQAGKIKSGQFKKLLEELLALKNVKTNLQALNLAPIVEGDQIPEFWCRQVRDDYYFFFAHPMANNLQLPVEYGFSHCEVVFSYPIKFQFENLVIPYTLRFEPYQSLLIKIDHKGQIEKLDINYLPPETVTEN